MRVTAGLDSGPVYLVNDEAIGAQDTYGTLSARLERLGGDLLVTALDRLPSPTDQDDSQATYADKITAEDRRLDPRLGAGRLARVVRALHPHIGAYLELADGTRLGVHEARAVPAAQAELAPGEIRLEPPHPRLGCSPGELELLVVQPPGRRAMSAEDYLRGRHA
jgi:methionyl-tRNA formyltransferase